MSDVQLLFAILGGLYAWECACWISQGGVFFCTWIGRHWRVQHPATILGNQRGGFVLAAPIPPLGAVLTTNQFPFSLGADGVLIFVSSHVNPAWRLTQSGRFLTWEEVGSLHVEGKKLLLQKEKIFSTSTVTRTNYLFQSLTAIAKLTREQREAAIKKLLCNGLDTTQLKTLRQDFDQQVRPIRFLANALFALVFVITPLLIFFVGLKLVWLWLFIALLGLTITTATHFYRLHRKFYPAASDERFTQTLILALAPATTMRAHDIASRPLLENFHPLAVAHQLLTPEAFRPFARRLLLDLRTPAPPTFPSARPQVFATELFYRRTLLEVVEAWLAEKKLPPEELCQQPAPADESCQAFCPRCEAQFTSTNGECSDCGGLPLVAFRKPS